MATYYIDSSTGSDSNDGSSGAPWLTIQHALDNAVGAEQHTFILSGSFTISSALVFTTYIATVTSAEMVNRYPIFDGQSTATLTLSVANAIAQICCLRSLNIVNTLGYFSGGTINPASSRPCFIVNCIVTGVQSAWNRAVGICSHITNARMQSAYDCTLVDTVGTLAASLMDNGTYSRCKIINAVSTSTGPAVRYVQLEHCSVYCPNITTGRLFSSDSFGAWTAFRSCVFHFNSGNVITVSSGHYLPIFKDCKVFGAAFSASPILEIGSNDVLSGAPFSDPGSEDFTPSSELIALAVSNLVAGAVQPVAVGSTTVIVIED